MSIPLYLASVLAIGILTQWIAWRIRVPAIVLLLVAGFALGRIASPEQYIGTQLLFPLVSLAVAVILFEGGLSLRFREVRNTGRIVLGLVTIGLLITAIGTFIAARWFLGFSTPMAALCGALLTVSGPTVIIPLLRHVRPHRRIGAIVKWEGIVNDPIGAVLAALVFKAIAGQPDDSLAGNSLGAIAWTVSIGGILGMVTAWAIIALFRRYLIPDYLQNPVVLAMVLFVYALSNHWQHESGLVTVTVLGIVLANQRRVSMRHIIEFKENLRVLLISILFIVLAARVQVSRDLLASLGWTWSGAWRGAAFLAALIFVIRPAAVAVGSLVGTIDWREKIFLAWIHPRGIVAAAVASLFALELTRLGKLGLVEPGLVSEAEQLVLVTFLVIVVTVTLYGLTLGPLATWLGISSPDPQGILFAGASRPVREIAHALHEEGFATLLVDTNAANIADARMAGLPTCHAHIGSEYAHETIDLGDLGRLLAMTPNDQINALAVMEFMEHFGRAGVYQLALPETTHERKESLPTHRRGRILFRPDASFDRLASLFDHGGRIKRTMLTDSFNFEHFLARYGPSTIVLFIIDKTNRLIVFTEDMAQPGPGQKIIALVEHDVDLPKSGA
ncbi:MAG: cation:proton antiporter [Pirellulales bacterium]|nr:cation:proton antiporter [Pirellulales bacterium]